jgi:Arc/MetJ-type ribon-helix-helix transcriptional regulator
MASSDWQLADAWSEDEVYTAATDKRGHSEDLHVRVPPDVARKIEVLIEARVHPKLRTRSDFVRDAIYHRLHYWQERGIPHLDTLADVEERARDTMMEVRRVEETVQSVREAVESLLRVDPEEARRFAVEAAERVPQKPHLRRYYWRLLEREFPHWLRGGDTE